MFKEKIVRGDFHPSDSCPRRNFDNDNPKNERAEKMKISQKIETTSKRKTISNRKKNIKTRLKGKVLILKI